MAVSWIMESDWIFTLGPASAT